MKKYFLGLWCCALSFAQTDDTVVIQEVDLTAGSSQCYHSYLQKLSDKNQFYSSKNTTFKGVYHKNGDVIPFSGVIENGKVLAIRDIKFNENFSKEEQGFYKKAFEEIYKVSHSYYLFSVNNSTYLKSFYCQNDEAKGVYTFRILGDNLKNTLKLGTDKKGNFSVWLTQDGIIDKIESFVDKREEKAYENLGNIHNFILNFIPYKKGVKLNKVKGKIINLKSNNHFDFEFIFN